MLHHLHLQGVGPAPEMKLDLHDRFNIITGDNGLGKSFLLDTAWWALTRKWPRELNPKLTSGYMARPQDPSKKCSIQFAISGMTVSTKYKSEFRPESQSWQGLGKGRPLNPGLVLYAMADGSFAVWDPARNYWYKESSSKESLPPYVFSPAEVWQGLNDEKNGPPRCNGLLADWASWQKENGDTFLLLKNVLEKLSASPEDLIRPGSKFARLGVNDSRDIPTLLGNDGRETPIVYASSGVRRIVALAYLLVWSWQEHRKICAEIGKPPTHQVVFLIDELEAHLHPKWQRTLVPALLEVVKFLAKDAEVQLIFATHSPLVMASLEPYFSDDKDAWFDLDYDQKEQAVLTQRDFEKHGTAENWLLSEAFDLPSARSPAYEKLIEDAAKLLEGEKPSAAAIKKMHQQLVEALSPKDDFLFTWRYTCKRKGWLKDGKA